MRDININIQSDIGFQAANSIFKFIDFWKDDSFIPMPSEWAAENRYLPAGTTEFPGYVDHSIAPHMVEIQDCLHPDSGISQITLMKGTQSLGTTAIENAIGHSIKYKLHNILIIISSKNIARIRSSAAIDVMIDNSGLAEYIKPISTRMKRKLADSTFYKEMHGGRRLMLTSWNSIADAKSLLWDLIYMDELEEAPYELRNQGDPEALFAGRGKTARNLKVVKMSTPTNTQGRIYINFLEGDQRYYFCKCPLCGELQILKTMSAGRDHGLTARSETIDEVEQIIIESVHYLCKFCKKDIYEYQKGDMLLGGKWIPTARPVNKNYRSYQVSNLMSPVMFYSWVQVIQEFCETDWGQNITKFKNFVIDVWGEPWATHSEKKSWVELKNKAEKYKLNEIQPGGLMVIGGADIQKNRIELQIVAWGRDMESWVIDYVTFWGETQEKNNKVWIDFRNFIITKTYKLKNIDLKIALTAIDSGYNPGNKEHRNDITVEHLVYDFVAKTPRTIACRGNDRLKDMIIKEERIKRRSLLKRRYDVAVSELKDETFIKTDFLPGTPGEIHFSVFLPDEYFRGLLSEVYAEVEPGRFAWKKIFDRNEPLDTYILSRAGAEYLNLPTWTYSIWDDYEKRIFN